MSNARKGVEKSAEHKAALRRSKLRTVEYKGNNYIGYRELFFATGVSYYLYNKFYKNGIDPEPYIGNNTHGMVKKNKEKPARAALGKQWYNNGECERYAYEPFDSTWQLGRLKR